MCDLEKELKKYAKKSIIKTTKSFFKEEYTKDDIFIGVRVPDIRKVAKQNKSINYLDLQKCIKSEIHEMRMLALFILIEKFPKEEERVYKFYIKNMKYVNNWDLVDTSCYKIMGKFLLDKNKDILYKLAKSKNLWFRRISIITTLYFIKNNKFNDTLKLAKALLHDKHDLIHKAVGWMLRELGKKDITLEKKFLDKYSKVMPRTMLRYAIEQFSVTERRKYMQK